MLRADQEQALIRLHRRQFVLGPEPLRAGEDWLCRQVDEATWLSHCPELRTGWTRDADGREWVLLGLAVETAPEGDAPLSSIADTSSSGVPGLYKSWAGRWLLITSGQVHSDAAALLGCFWAALGGRTWASSSPALLAAAVFDSEIPTADPRPLLHEVGISWVTPPRSRFPGINRLLPSQWLDLAAGEPRRRPWLPAIESSLGHERGLELVATGVMTTLRRVATELGPPWLGLTAGFDSRVVLAASRRAGVEVRPFTRVSPRVSGADRRLPRALARACGYDHRFVHERHSDSDRWGLVLEHSAGHVARDDVEPLLQGVRDELDGVSIGGHAFSVGGGFADLRRLPRTLDDPAEAAHQVADLFGEPVDSTAAAGVREWVEWALQDPQEGLDWRDRFLIEQRLGGWLAAKEQVYDMARLRRFPLLNSARNYALLLSLPEERRLRSGVQVELIRRLQPALLDYPFNPPEGGLRRIRRWARKIRP